MTDIVITGGSGMLGRALMRELADYAPVGTALSRVRDGLERLDLLDEPALRAFLERHRPKVVIHAAAERRPDVSQREPERTAALNVDSTRALARISGEIGAYVLYLSTDYVFDGTKPPYGPDDETNPLNLYGQTKRAGEQALLAALPSAGVLRVGVLFGQVETAGESAVTVLLDDVMGNKPTAIDDWARRYPTYIPDVAVLCHQMIEGHLGGEDMSGIWHWCGDEQLSKYDQTVMIGRIMGMPTDHLTADPDPPRGAPRPRDCRLDCSGLETQGLGRRTPFRDALETSLRESGLLPI